MIRIIFFYLLFCCSLNAFCETTEELLLSFENLTETSLHDLEVVETSAAATIYVAKDEQNNLIWLVVSSILTKFIPSHEDWMGGCTMYVNEDFCNFVFSGIRGLITISSLGSFGSKAKTFLTSLGTTWKYETNYQRVTSFVKFSVDTYDAAQNIKKLIGDFGMSNSCQVMPFSSGIYSNGTCFSGFQENYKLYEWNGTSYYTILVSCKNSDPAEIYYWPGSSEYKAGYYQKIHYSKDPYLFTKILDNAMLKACGCD